MLPDGKPYTLAGHKDLFQWAPTLGGECYDKAWEIFRTTEDEFQWAPTLGGECYDETATEGAGCEVRVSMGTHPWG